jgi:hypothetical protein
MSHLGTWTQNNFIAHENSDETQHPAHYLKCEKLIDGVWVNTGWAPHLKAVEQHARALGGSIRALNNVLAVVYEYQEKLDNNTELCDKDCLEHN